MNIKQSSRAYEAWLGRRIPLIEADLRLKHQRMKESPFSFLRATFYRWVQLWPQVCAELATAQTLLGVGDLHVENFGTWRDSDGRLIWGVNDFDEAFPLAYTNDLVRLAVSALLAIREGDLSCTPGDACRSILAGYQEGFDDGGQPFVLSEHHRFLRDLATNELRDPVHFWGKLGALPTVRQRPPAEVTRALEKTLPEPRLNYRVVHRCAGLGSLGRRRFTALAEWRGGMIAREAKQLVTSAWVWESGASENKRIYYQTIIDRAMRAPDPFVGLQGCWVIRRLAPYCSRITLASLPKVKDTLRLLHAMGQETSNIHLGTKAAARSVAADLATHWRSNTT